MSEPQRTTPSAGHRLWSAVTSAIDFACDGFATVDEDTFQARLAVCANCDRRQDSLCSECGCYIKPKAAGRTFNCPLGRWDVPDTGVLPARLHFTVWSDDIPAELASLAASYTLQRERSVDENGIGRFRAVWQSTLDESMRGAAAVRITASTVGVQIEFHDFAGRPLAVGWRRSGWILPLMVAGPLPLEPIGAARQTLIVWPCP